MICVSTFVNAQEKETDNFKKTDQVLSEVVKKALLVAEKTGNFVIEQSPLILQEFYNWHICSKLFFILFSILIFLMGRYIPTIWLTKESTNKYNIKFFGKFNNTTDSWDSFSASWLIFSITTISSTVMLGINIYNLVFILVAPKLYLIEYFIK